MKVYRKDTGQSFEREDEAARAVVAAEPDLYTLEDPQIKAAGSTEEALGSQDGAA